MFFLIIQEFDVFNCLSWSTLSISLYHNIIWRMIFQLSTFIYGSMTIKYKWTITKLVPTVLQSFYQGSIIVFQ